MAIKRPLKIFVVPRYGYIGRDYVVARITKEAFELGNDDVYAEFIPCEDFGFTMNRYEACVPNHLDIYEECFDDKAVKKEELRRLIKLQKERERKP